ncbi:hypothetical protein AB4232_22490 [Vibrio sp. 10N.286.46.A8]|uniref:hypothetical protein n=1 Tax=unclassified Vibrio TaxID=2614977 RepID=UPI00352CFAA8
MKLDQPLFLRPDLIRDDFRQPQKYDVAIETEFKLTTAISDVVRGVRIVNDEARRKKVTYEDVIQWAVSQNRGLPRQPSGKEGKFRGRIGEVAFNAMFDGLDMNEIEPNHPGWDFEYKNSLVEIKSTSPEDGKNGTAKLSQGDSPDVYLIFLFSSSGTIRSAYLLPVDIVKCRKKGIPKGVKINDSQWVSQFEISLDDLGMYFDIRHYYRNYFLKDPIAIPRGILNKAENHKKLSKYLNSNQRLNVTSLFNIESKWWLSLFSAQIHYVRHFGHSPVWEW